MHLIKKNYWIFITIFVFGLDRFTKILAINYLRFEPPLNVLPIFNLIFTFNKGSAFSFLNKASGWQEWLFIGVAIIVSIFLIIWLYKITVNHIWLKVALALVLGGTLGNLYDRIIYHSVIDFLDFYFRYWHYPTFNIADSVICIGAIMLIIDIFTKKKV
jgi:signal peptidase II